MKDAQRLIERLARGAAAIRALAEGMGDEEARWRPLSGGWTVLEAICHLKDEEVEDFRQRLRLTLEDPGQPWPAIDPQGWVAARRYAERSIKTELAAFLSERTKSLDWLRGLAAPDWSRVHTHPKFPPMAAGDLLASWVAHDLLHVRQIARIQYEHARATAEPFRPDYAGAPPPAPSL